MSDSDHDLSGPDYIAWVKYILRTKRLTENEEREKDELLCELAMYIMKYKNRVIF
jgi:hypothetical protein